MRKYDWGCEIIYDTVELGSMDNALEDAEEMRLERHRAEPRKWIYVDDHGATIKVEHSYARSVRQ